MSDEFNPYRKWLGIPPAEQPPDHYRLLGVERFETSREVIENAAFARMALLKTFAAGPQSAASQRLLNEVAAAKLCLLNPSKRRAYDQELRGDEAGEEAGGETAAQADVGFPDPSPTAAAAPQLPPVGQTPPVWQPLPADDLFAEVPLQRPGQLPSPQPLAPQLTPLQPWPAARAKKRSAWLIRAVVAGGVAIIVLVTLLVVFRGGEPNADAQRTGDLARSISGDSADDAGPDDSANVTPKVAPDVRPPRDLTNQDARGATWSYDSADGARAVGFSPDGKYLAATLRIGSHVIWELATGSARHWSAEKSPTRLDFNPQGHLLIGTARQLRIIDPETGKSAHDAPRLTGPMYGTSPDGRFIPARDGSSLYLALFETATGRKGPRLPYASQHTVAMAFSADGRFLAIAGTTDRRIKVLDYKTLESVHEFAAQEGRSESLEFSPDGALLVAAVQYRALRCWNVADWSRRWDSERRSTCHLAFAPDGRMLASTDYAVLEIRRPDDGTVLSRTDVGWAINDVDFSPDGRLLAIASDRGVQIYPVTPDAQLPPPPQRPR